VKQYVKQKAAELVAGGDILLRNVGSLSTEYTMLHPEGKTLLALVSLSLQHTGVVHFGVPKKK
jgi:hypothetical protein